MRVHIDAYAVTVKGRDGREAAAAGTAEVEKRQSGYLLDGLERGRRAYSDRAELLRQLVGTGQPHPATYRVWPYASKNAEALTAAKSLPLENARNRWN